MQALCNYHRHLSFTHHEIIISLPNNHYLTGCTNVPCSHIPLKLSSLHLEQTRFGTFSHQQRDGNPATGKPASLRQFVLLERTHEAEQKSKPLPRTADEEFLDDHKEASPSEMVCPTPKNTGRTKLKNLYLGLRRKSFSMKSLANSLVLWKRSWSKS